MKCDPSAAAADGDDDEDDLDVRIACCDRLKLDIKGLRVSSRCGDVIDSLSWCFVVNSRLRDKAVYHSGASHRVSHPSVAPHSGFNCLFQMRSEPLYCVCGGGGRGVLLPLSLGFSVLVNLMSAGRCGWLRTPCLYFSI